MGISNSVEKFVRNLVAEKCVGKRFKQYSYSSQIGFVDDGPFLVEAVEFRFTSKGHPGNYECLTDYSTPIYELTLTGTNTETGKKFYMSEIDIQDLP